jgi:YVTN family beta-propeller protein
MNPRSRSASTKFCAIPPAAVRSLKRLWAFVLLTAIVLLGLPAMAQSAHYGGQADSTAAQLVSPQSLAVDGLGNVFVSNAVGAAGYPAGVYKVEAVNGRVAQSSAVVQIATANGSLAVDAGNNLYIAVQGTQSILKYAAVGGEVTAGSSMTVVSSNDFTAPTALAVDSSGYLIVVDQGKFIYRLAPDDSSNNRIGSGYFYGDSVVGVAVDGANNVYVADATKGAVYQIEADNGVVSGNSAVWDIAWPNGTLTAVAADARGDLFFSDNPNPGTGEAQEIPAGASNSEVVFSSYTAPSLPVALGTGLHGEIYIADIASGSLVNPQVRIVLATPPDFGKVTVGQTGSANLPFTFDSTTTLGSTIASVLGQGVGGQEYTYQAQSGASYCQANQTYQTGQSCLISVAFSPQHPGLRLGAAELLDMYGNILASVPLAGTGVASQLSYLTFTAPTNLYSQYTGDPSGVAVDSQGNVFYADSDQDTVFELVGGGGSPQTISSSFGCPEALAFDGGGNLFVADYCNQTVYAIQADSNGHLSSNSNVVDLSSVVSYSNGFGGFDAPWGVAVDGAGNVFVTDANTSGQGTVYEIVADSTGHISGSSSVVQIATGFNQPQGLARDANGNLFLADTHNLLVKEIVAVNGQVSASSQVVTVGSGFVFPTSVAVDAAGNVYVTDQDNTEVNCPVKIILAANGAVSSASKVITLTNGLTLPWGIAVDASGNLFFTNQANASVQELPFGVEPAQITFNTATPVGSLDATDDPQNLTLANIGNAARSFSSAASIQGGGFLFDGLTTCSQSGAYTINSGSSCTLALDFQPSTYGTLAGTLSLGDSSLATIALSGVGATEPMLSVPPAYNFGNVQAGTTASTLLTISNTGNAPMQLDPSAFIARVSGAADFSVGLGGSCQAGGNLNADGSCTVEIDYSPAAGFYSPEAAVFTVYSNGGNKPVSVSAVSLLSLTQPALAVSTATLDFGSEVLGVEAAKANTGIPFTQLTLTLTNEGAGTLDFTDLTTTTGVEDFYWQFENAIGVSGSTCVSTKHYGASRLTTGQSCTIQYAFMPWLNGARQGNLHIGSNSAGGDFNLTLQGVGVLPPGVVAVVPQKGFSFRGGGKLAAIDPARHTVLADSGGYLTTIDTNTLAYNSIPWAYVSSPTALALDAATGKLYGAGGSGIHVFDEETQTASFFSVPAETFSDIAVNPVTNKIYLTDDSTKIGVLDGAANTYSTIAPAYPYSIINSASIAVDSGHDYVYVLDNYTGKLVPINGHTNQPAITNTITGLPTQGTLLTFNPMSNTLYTNGSSSFLSVISGYTDLVSKISGINTGAVTVNPVTDLTYATNFPVVWSSYAQTATIAVINSFDQSLVTNIPVGQASAGPEAIAVDTVSNEIYVSNGGSNSVSVIDGVANTVSATVATDYDPGAIVVDEAAHRAYVLNERFLPQGNPTGSVFVIASPKDDGPALAPEIAASFGTGTIGINSTTSLNFVITNPNSSSTLSSIAFQALLPSGLQAAAGTTAACDGALATAANGALTLTGALIAPGGQCTVSLTVTGAAAGSYTVNSGAVTAWPSLTGNTASATLTVSSSPIVSGAVTAYGLPLAGVALTYQAYTTAYQSGTATTDSNGNYSFTVTAGWSGTITPSLTGYTFTPSYNWIPAVATGAQQNFTAVITPPVVITSSTIGSASTTIASGGAVADQGGAPVTARGVCYSTAANPAIGSNCTSDGTGAGAFTSTLTGLELNTTYHVRAYAISAAGVFYGSDVEFTTMSPGASGSVAGAYAYITGGVSNAVTVIDTASQRVLSTVVLNPAGPMYWGDFCPYGVANSSTSGKIYVSFLCVNSVSAINSSTLGVADYIQVPITSGGSTMSAVTSLDGSLVYVSDDEGPGPSAGNIHVINTATDAISSFHIDKASYDLKLHPDGTRLFATNLDDSTVTAVDLTTNTVTATIATGQYPFGMVINNAGTRAYTANYGDNTVSVIDVTSGSPTLNSVLNTISVGNVPMDVAVSNDDSRLYVSNYNDHTVTVYNTAGDANTLIGTITLPNAPKGLAMQPGSSYLWVLLPGAGQAVIVNTAGDADTIVNTIAVSGEPVQFGSFFSTVATAAAPRNPVIDWATPAAIAYGTALDSTQLNAAATYNGAAVPGTFAYTPAAGTELGAGVNQTLSVTFTPDDTTHYNSATATVQLTVNQAAPVIRVTPYSLTYDGNSHIATATATGVGGVNLASDLNLTATTHTSSGTYSTDAWSFTDPSGNYASASGSIADTIAKADSPITVSCPPSVIYNGSAQTPCTANVTGAGGLSQSLPVSYSNNVNAGTATADASFAGDADHNGNSNSAGFTISPASQTIVFGSIPTQVTGTQIALTATASSGLPVSFASSTTGVCTVSGSTATLLQAGICSIAASQAGSSNDSAAAPVTQSFSVVVAPSITLTVTSALSKVLGGYQVTVTISNTGNASAANVQVTLATLASVSGTPLPAVLGTIAVGGSASVTIDFPSSAGADNTSVVEKLAGTYTGGSFSANGRAKLP